MRINLWTIKSTKSATYHWHKDVFIFSSFYKFNTGSRNTDALNFQVCSQEERQSGTVSYWKQCKEKESKCQKRHCMVGDQPVSKHCNLHVALGPAMAVLYCFQKGT